MVAAATDTQDPAVSAGRTGHRLWVRLCHWVLALSFLTLAFSGFVVLMAQPRLYWGETGNDLMPALLELPISPNLRPDDWRQVAAFDELPTQPVSAYRTYEAELFNQNGWARSLHFLAGWFLVTSGAIFAIAGLLTGHTRRDLLPSLRELGAGALWRDVRAHARFDFGPRMSGGPPYGPLQKLSYAGVAFVLLPLMVLTGLTMSPAVTAAWPMLLDIFGGYQSARTLHFFGFALLVLFLLVHVAMVFLTGFFRQMRAMTWGS